MEIEYSAHQDEDDTAHIISMLLMARPKYQQQVQQQIAQMEGCEVHGNDNEGRIIVVAEAETNKQLAQRMDELQALEHLVSSSLVFHQLA